MENAHNSSTLCLTVLLLINPLSISQGTLKNGKVVAVKKLALGQSSRVKADFASEVTLISNVHHRNLIRLLGRCTKGPELLLVYEYMANSSLDRFLFGNVNRL
jgi:serine/threonine protein kinase